jgi:hypothetical protein
MTKPKKKNKKKNQLPSHVGLVEQLKINKKKKEDLYNQYK